MMKTSVIVLCLSAIYATVRYNILQQVAWSDWPVYTMNKAFALSALVLLVVAVVQKTRPAELRDPRLLPAAGIFALVHVLLSLTVFSPAYFEKFFVNDRLTAEAGWSIALGAVAAAAMAAGAVKTLNGTNESPLRSLAAVAFLIGLHAAFQGISGWFAPDTWPGWMPPITLISFLLGVAAMGIARSPKRL